jgi:uncharacterized surface protein with fasciclin (FAS1) repeats
MRIRWAVSQKGDSDVTRTIQQGWFAAALAAVLVVCAPSARAADLVEVAAGSDQFQTLVTAVKAAGLVETLKGKGPFTVFAPTDAAFARLPEGTLATLLKPENKAKLAAILTYHVVPSRIMAADVVKLKSGTEVATAQGDKVKVTHDQNGVRVNDARVIQTDIAADNGVIHVIDTVLLPPTK